MNTFPFAGVVNRKELPDGPEFWENCARNLIWFHDLYLTQDCLVIEKLFRAPKYPLKDNGYIRVVLYKDKLFLYNGHHRVVLAALRGEHCMWGRLYIMKD